MLHVFSWTLAFCLRACRESDSYCSVSSSWSSLGCLLCGIFTFLESLSCSWKMSKALLLSQHGLRIHSTIHQPGIHWLSQHWWSQLQGHSRQIHLAAVGSRQEATVPLDPQLLTTLAVVWMHLEGRGTWQDGSFVCFCMGFLENKEMPRGQAGAVEKFLLERQKGHAVKLHALL